MRALLPGGGVLFSQANVPETPAPPHLCQNPAVFLPDHGTGTGTGLRYGQQKKLGHRFLSMEGISRVVDFSHRGEERDDDDNDNDDAAAKIRLEAVRPTGVLVQGALPADRGSPVIDCDLE